MILQVENLEKSFAGNRILRDVSFQIEAGSVLALCGASGSGKTTLIRIISGLARFNEGNMTIGNISVNVNDPFPRELYGKIGVVFQDHNLFPHMTALQNIEIGLRCVKRFSVTDARSRARGELEKVGLSNKAESYPSTLSGGEKQRVAIARALAMDPLMLLLDEPTSGLDPSLIDEVLRIIVALAEEGTTMLLATHNIWMAKKTGSRFAFLEGGNLKVSDDSSILSAMDEMIYR